MLRRTKKAVAVAVAVAESNCRKQPSYASQPLKFLAKAVKASEDKRNYKD